MKAFQASANFERFWPVIVAVLLSTFSFYACSGGGGPDPVVSDADGDGYNVEQGDCDDADSGISPGATEVCGDTIDQDCSGADLACTTGDVNTALLAAADTWMYQIQGLDEDGAVDILAAGNYSLLVLEPGHNYNDSKYDTTAIVSALRRTPDDQPRLLLAYIDIGQAEDYRDYWGADWIAPTADQRGTPDFLITIDPDGWSGNYPVAYWVQDWKDIWLGDDGIIATLAEFGFDGIYLDWVEAYDDEKVMAAATAEGVDPQLEMILFIEEMRSVGRAIDPDFLVIPQNAPYLIDADPDRYAATIDALAVEDTWFHGDGDAEWDDPRAGDLHERHDDEWSTANRLLQYQEYISRGLPVFTVDYCISTTNADQVYTDAAAAGLRPLVTRVSLSQMTVTPPPAEEELQEATTSQFSLGLTGSLQNPAWSPDGKELLFTEFKNGYNFEPADLYVYNLETKALRQLVSDGSGNVNLPGTVWNQNTGQVVFSSTRDPHDEIYSIDANGVPGQETAVTSRDGLVAYEPSFSADGQWVVFESHQLDVEENGIIMKYKVDGSEAYSALTSLDGDCRQPNWSPSGDSIVYQRLANNQWDLWIVNIDGTNAHQVTSGAGDKTDVSFSPDGQWLVYSTDQAELDFASLFILPVSGGDSIRVTEYSGYAGAPSWSPDGSQIAFEASSGDPDQLTGTTLWLADVPAH